MNKAELAAAVAEKLGGNEPEARRYVDTVFETIMRQVAAGDRVQVIGFGTFDRIERAARLGRNPQTGDRIQVPAGTSPRFHAGQTFRTRVTDAAGPLTVATTKAAVEAAAKEKKKAVKPVKVEKKAKTTGKKPGKATTATTTPAKTGPTKKATQKPAKAGKK